jgi:hypothetical protein
LNIADDAVANNRILDHGPIVYEFQCANRGLNINQPLEVTFFQEIRHGCTFSLSGTGIPYERTKHSGSIYLSDLGEIKYGDSLVLWQASRSSDEEPGGGRFYMPIQGIREAETELTISGADMYESLEEQGLIGTSGTMRIGFTVDDESVVYASEQLSSLSYPISDATAFIDIGQRWHCYGWKGAAVLNPLQIVWESEEPPPSEKELVESWDRYLEEHRAELEAKYKGKYVAIYEDTVYDSDIDLAALAKRVYSTLGYRQIFMPYIGKHKSVAEFLSPE